MLAKRAFLLAAGPLWLLAGCGASSLSCESLNQRQSNAALRTCVGSAALRDRSSLAAPLDGGGSYVIDSLPSVWSRATFDDGRVLYVDEKKAHFSDGTAKHETVPVGAEGSSAAAPVGDRYALALADGRLSIRSRDSAAVFEMPIKIEFMHIDKLAFAESVPLSFSGDATRLAVVEASRQAFVLDAKTGERIWETTLTKDAKTVALSSDGSLIAVALDDASVCVWRLAQPSSSNCREHHRPVADAVFSPDDRHLIVWLSERSRKKRVNIYKPHRTPTGNNPAKVRTVVSKTPPAVVLWRLH